MMRYAVFMVFAVVGTAAAAEPADAISFHKQIRPILQQKCQGCHQPAQKKGRLLLTDFEGFAAGGTNGASFVAGKPEESLLVFHLKGSNEKSLMPPKGEPPLTVEQIALFERWIRQGAKDDTPPQFRRTLATRELPKYSGPVMLTAVAFSPDGTTLAVSGYREVILHKVEGGEIIGRLPGLSERIESIVFSPDGNRLAVAGGSAGRFGEIQFWDWRKKILLKSVMPSYDTVYGASFSPDGKRLSFGCADNTARIISVPDGKPLLRIEHHQDWVFGTALSNDGKYIVSCSRDRTVKLCESDTGSFIDNITTITPGLVGGGLRGLVRRPGKDEYLTAGEDGIPKLYQMLRTRARQIGDDFNLIRNFGKLNGRVEALAFSADGKLLGAAGAGGMVRVFSVDDAKLIADLPVPCSIFSIAFRPDGKVIAAAGKDGLVRLFALPEGKPVKEFVPVPVENPAAAAR
jgi:WD40 repeat protein